MTPINITQDMLTRSSLAKEVAAFKEECEASALVKTCDVELREVLGWPTSNGEYGLQISGMLDIKTSFLAKLKVDAKGVGVFNPVTRKITIDSVSTSDDGQGILGKLLALTGLAKGRQIKVKRRDAELYQELLGTSRAA